MMPFPKWLESMGYQKSVWFYSNNPTAGTILKNKLPTMIDNSMT
jgi:hypothetical protein